MSKKGFILFLVLILLVSSIYALDPGDLWMNGVLIPFEISEDFDELCNKEGKCGDMNLDGIVNQFDLIGFGAIVKNQNYDYSIDFDDNGKIEFCINGDYLPQDERCVKSLDYKCMEYSVENEIECGVTCTDSDDGINFYVKGTVTLKTDSGELSETDFCAIGNGNENTEVVGSCAGEACWINEWYCEGGEVGPLQRKQCDNCEDGACIPGYVIFTGSASLSFTDSSADFTLKPSGSQAYNLRWTNKNGQEYNTEILVWDENEVNIKLGVYSGGAREFVVNEVNTIEENEYFLVSNNGYSHIMKYISATNDELRLKDMAGDTYTLSLSNNQGDLTISGNTHKIQINEDTLAIKVDLNGDGTIDSSYSQIISQSGASLGFSTITNNDFTLRPSGSNNYKLTWKNKNGQLYNEEIVAYDGTKLRLGEMSGSTFRILNIDESVPMSRTSKDKFLVSKNGYSYIMKYTGYSATSNNIDLKDTAGDTFKISLSNNQGDLTISGNTHKIIVNSDETINVDLNGDGTLEVSILGEEQWVPEWCPELVSSGGDSGGGSSGTSISLLQKLKELGLEGKQIGDFDISGLEISKIGFHTLIKQKSSEIHLLQKELPNDMILSDNKGNSVNIKTDNIQDSFSGYIVEFEDEPVLEYKNNLDTEIKVMGKEIDQLKEEINNLDTTGIKAIINVPRKWYKNWQTNSISSKKEKATLSLPEKLREYKAMLTENHDSIKESITKKVNKEVKRSYKNVFNGISLDISKQELKSIEAISGVKKIHPNVKVKLLLYESRKVINSDDLNGIKDLNGDNITGKGITVAVIDTGVDYTHEDLGGCLGENCKVIGGYDVVNRDNDPMDDHGHGTHVAATIAGDGVLTGIAPDAKIYAIKVLDSGGSGSFSGVIEGIERAVDPNQDGNFDDRVDILSMSLGGPGNPDDPVSKAVDNAVNAGVISIIAAGNAGCRNCIGSPGTARKAITIAASDKCNQIAEFSSRGPVIWEGGMILKPDVAAPGVSICAAQWNGAWDDRLCLDNEHVAISGTSMATPHVSGLAALLLQSHPNWNPEDVKSALMGSAYDMGYTLYEQGMGRIDSLRANSVNLITNPSTISFGLEVGEYGEITKELIIKNLKSEGVSLTIDPGILKDENENKYGNVLSVDSSLQIGANSQEIVSLIFNIPQSMEGAFYGNLIINDGEKDYKVPYSFSKYSKLTVIVDGEGKAIFPSIYIHNEDMSFFRGASQGWEFEENEYTFNVINGQYTVYAIGDNEDWSFEYILYDIIDVPSDSQVTKTLRISDARPFLIKAHALDGRDLFLYEWTKGLKIYNENRRFSSTYSDPTTGDRTVHISNKPDNAVDIDILLKYFGIPVNEE